MPDTPTAVPDVDVATTSSSSGSLLAALADGIVAVPGVVRLEPTLSTSGPSVLLRRSPTDGVRIIIRASIVEVDVSVVTTAACQARAVTHHVQSVIASLLSAHGYTRGSVAVSVLAIDPI